MRLQPGSLGWLLAHDVRLNWRSVAGLLGHASTGVTVCVLVAVAAGLHLGAVFLVPLLAPTLHGGATSAASLATVLICTFTWMIAQSLFGATRALSDRADLDLLAGSPLPASHSFAAKALGLTAGTFGALGLLLLPIANVSVLLDGPIWLSLYPVLVALALVATAIGLSVSIGLFLAVGPRRARTYAHMTGAGIGGAFLLGAQIVSLLPSSTRAVVMSWLEGDASSSNARPSHGLLWLPVNALQGDVGSAGLMLGLGAAALAICIWALSGAFAKASLAGAGAPASQKRLSDERLTTMFGQGLNRSIMLKEWRLLVRDPGFFAQLGLQIIYTIPVAVFLLRSETLPMALACAPALVVIAAQVTASIAWVTVSGEDAPELLATAPVSRGAVEGAKLSAIVAPVLVVLGPPILGLCWLSWETALITTVFATGASASTALLNFWHPMPGNRRGMLRRHSQSKLVALIEHGLVILWAMAVVFALFGTVIVALPLGLIGLVLWLAGGKHGLQFSWPRAPFLATSQR